MISRRAMLKRSTVIVLVGPKGAGKSTLCALLARAVGAEFVRVEPVYLNVLRAHPDQDPASLEPAGFGAILEQVHAAAARSRTVCLESTGTAGYFPTFLARLQARHRVVLVRVSAPGETCAERVRSRDVAEHIPVSDERVREINRVAEGVRLAWDLEVDNSGRRPAEDVARELARALAPA